jgi:hypothetical protein
VYIQCLILDLMLGIHIDSIVTSSHIHSVAIHQEFIGGSVVILTVIKLLLLSAGAQSRYVGVNGRLTDVFLFIIPLCRGPPVHMLPVKQSPCTRGEYH